ncbi:hypothetical protein [Ascidiimonas aurantiaca]|uniref:hypothetical protein n=1 Tax=Ascidiimonas aurantiaca TaxID=1685432 RepID=UPI0030ECD801
MDKKKYTYTTLRIYLVLAGWFLLWGAPSALWAQNPVRVSSTVDSVTIKIGEQINYLVNVEADTTAIIVFPEIKTLGRMEVIESYPTDTATDGDRMRLIKKYGITQFDSGSYALPRLEILVNNRSFYTDSLNVQVNDVAVDTTQQKMYDIKPVIQVNKSSTQWWLYVLIGILVLLIIAGAVYWFVFRKKPITEEEKIAKLPPFERAMLELKNLEQSKYLIQSEYKQYYSELTGIVRAYLEEDVNISALESTTEELITKLQMLKDGGNLNIEEETISQFKRILQAADLVKFARSKPEMKAADADRKAIEQIVIKTKEGLPEPTEEDLMDNEAYLEEQNRKKRKKKIIYAAAVGAFLIFAIGTAATVYYGFTNVKDTLTGHPTKKLLESEWIASDYGFPPISIETPEVLLRQDIPIPPENRAAIKDMHVFGYHNQKGLFSIAVSSIMYNEGVEVSMEKAINGMLELMEKNGAKNLVTKQEEFNTRNGIKGVKTFGSGTFAVPGSEEMLPGEYVLLVFAGENFQQNVMLSWKKEDTYAEAIVERILNRIEVNTN